MHVLGGYLYTVYSARTTLYGEKMSVLGMVWFPAVLRAATVTFMVNALLDYDADSRVSAACTPCVALLLLWHVRRQELRLPNEYLDRVGYIHWGSLGRVAPDRKVQAVAVVQAAEASGDKASSEGAAAAEDKDGCSDAGSKAEQDSKLRNRKKGGKASGGDSAKDGGKTAAPTQPKKPKQQ